MSVKKIVKTYLGMRVEDKVTGFTGVVSSVSFDLYGCMQAIVTPSAEAGGSEIKDSKWMGVNRLNLLDSRRVMPLPAFETIDYGPAEKPAKEVV